MTVEEQRTSLIKIIKDCQIFNKYIVIDTGKILFLFDIEDDVYLTIETYNEFKKDKKFKDNFLHSSELLDKDGQMKIEIMKMEIIKILMEVLKGIEKKVDTDFQVENKPGVDNLLDKIGNYFSVRRLGDIRITSFNLESNKIDMKIIIEKRLEKLGINYDITEIEKIVSFTEL
jgi:hypothetical protein